MYKKVTINLPIKLVEVLDRSVGNGNKSNFIADAIKQKIAEIKIQEITQKLTQKAGAWERFRSHRENAPKMSTEEILEAVRWGRK